jgi:D-arabinose 1-dehydrogenase-like Zn-dependent alcohol dehydrogenase
LRSDFLQKDAQELGADEFIETKEGFAKAMQDKIDIIIVCTLVFH